MMVSFWNLDWFSLWTISPLLFVLFLCFNLTCSVCWCSPWRRLKASEGPDGWTDGPTDISSVLAGAMLYSAPPPLQTLDCLNLWSSPRTFPPSPIHNFFLFTQESYRCNFQLLRQNGWKATESFKFFSHYSLEDTDRGVQFTFRLFQQN